MDQLELITALVNTTPTVIFLYLFWIERKRSSDLSDDRVRLVNECNQKLEDLIDRHFTLVDKVYLSQREETGGKGN